MEITRHGEKQETNGNVPALGHKVPDFAVTTAEGTKLTAADLKGEYTLISVVPDINTRVCSISTKTFNKSVDEFKNVHFLTVSTNTNKEQEDWCAAEGVKSMKLVSDADHNFGDAFGLYVPSNGTDARSVWILNPDDEIAYREVITEQTEEPDYSAALAYLEAHQNA
ncbi:peroxiredoxin [Lacticaseibacillus pabuli]|uniref:Peroxiredoxin n=1 Tax=Lacticaseibacillus pabuli TaxID=3025672 RepID=A0ABY7WSP3_9LACO|nr:peroxiredoxin [Lacticaseibacillus sp. KACC 23028]WDF83146.1 peroxiredoxin [Lacticaseibacillus sp. KACC 23028]